jgi:hypothetical protein
MYSSRASNIVRIRSTRRNVVLGSVGGERLQPRQAPAFFAPRITTER